MSRGTEGNIIAGLVWIAGCIAVRAADAHPDPFFYVAGYFVCIALGIIGSKHRG